MPVNLLSRILAAKQVVLEPANRSGKISFSLEPRVIQYEISFGNAHRFWEASCMAK
jgi:hypothetical protein